MSKAKSKVSEAEQVIGKLESRLALARAAILEFSVEVVEKPAHAMEWSDSIFQNAAEVRVYGLLLEALTRKDSNATLETMREYALKQALQGARRPDRSTSVASNLLNQYETEIWAQSIDPVCGVLS